MSTPEGKPRNINVGSLKPIPGKREYGWGVKKWDDQGIQGADKPIFEGAAITETQRLANERWREINKRMERYTQQQEGKIHDEYFDRTTAWFKSHGFTSQNIGREVQRPEMQMEMAAIFEECMKMVDRSLEEDRGNQRPNTPPDQGTSDDSSSTSFK